MVTPSAVVDDRRPVMRLPDAKSICNSLPASKAATLAQSLDGVTVRTDSCAPTGLYATKENTSAHTFDTGDLRRVRNIVA